MDEKVKEIKGRLTIKGNQCVSLEVRIYRGY